MKIPFVLKLSLLAFFAFLFSSKSLQAQIACSYTVNNSGGCPITVDVVLATVHLLPASPIRV